VPSMSFFGQGSTLRELPWRLPVGPMTIATGAVEEALRERMLAKHLEDIDGAGIPLTTEWSGGPSKTWRSKAFKLFGEFVKAGEMERALDVARIFLAAGGASGVKILDMAQKFAERAGQHKLADEVASLSSHVVDPVGDAVGDAARPATTIESPLPDRRKLPPLFRPGELDDEGQGSYAAKAVAAGTMEKAVMPAEGEASIGKVDASSPAPTAHEEDDSRRLSKPSSEGLGDNPPQAASEGTAHVEVPVANPFARKRPQAPANSRPTHMLRDAMGLGVSSKRGLALPATPMAAESTKKARS